MAEPVSIFTQTTQDFISRSAYDADVIADLLGISRNALMGAVANEYDTRINPDLTLTTRGGFAQYVGDAIGTSYNHNEILENYNELKAGEEKIGGKWRNAAMVDVGPGNIRVETAIDLLKSYIASHPDEGDDPLDLKQYENDYEKLVTDLVDFDSTKTTFAIAGLYVREADAYFADKDAAAWGRLTTDEQDALRVTYYKIGPETLSSNIDARISEAIENGTQFDFNPHGDGGQQHLNNVVEIKSAIAQGLTGMGDPTAPRTFEYQIESIALMNGGVIVTARRKAEFTEGALMISLVSDGEGNLLTERRTDDDGGYSVTTFDPVSGQATTRNIFDSQLRLWSETSFDDQGTQLQTVHDLDNEEAWSRSTIEYNSTGQRVSENYYNDDGTRSEIILNPADGTTVSRKNFDSSGNLTYDSIVEAQQAAEAERLAAEAKAIADAQAAAAHQTYVAGRRVFLQGVRQYYIENAISYTNRTGFPATPYLIEMDKINKALQGPEANMLAVADAYAQQFGQAAAAIEARERQRQAQAAANAAAWAAQQKQAELAAINTPGRWNGHRGVLNNSGSGGDYYSGVDRGNVIGYTSVGPISDGRNSWGGWSTPRATYSWDPVLVDLNRDSHIDLRPFNPDELSAATDVFFDWNGDGTGDRTAWVGPGDGFLAIDLNAEGGAGADGLIDQTRELAFTSWLSPEQHDVDGLPATDLDALRLVFDSNNDNVLDENDTRWSEFRIWRDLNQNGASEAGELMTMEQAGIKLFNLLPNRENVASYFDGSSISGTSTYETTDGSTALIADARLAYQPYTGT